MRNKKLAKGVTLLLVGTLLLTAVPVSAATVSGDGIMPVPMETEVVEAVILEEVVVPEENATAAAEADKVQEDATLAVEHEMTEDGLEYEVQTENGIPFINITKCPRTVKEVSIPSDIDGVSVTSIGVEAFKDCSSLTSITIPEGVTSIGRHAFCDCSSLTSITIPGNVTSIGTHAFHGCSGLTSITIPNSVTDIGNAAFSFCSSLTSISVATENTVYDSRENCNAIIEKTTNKLVAGCKNTKIPNSVTSIGVYAFGGCSGLTSITIPGSVTSLGEQAFYECSGLTSIIIPESVTSIGVYAFNECSSLTSIIIPESVTSIGVGAFGGCSSLTGITIPEGVKSIENGVFGECSSLTSITIPKGVTSIGRFLFHECSSLTSIIIPESVTSIGAGAFRGCSSLTDVYYAGSISQWRKITIKEENSALTGASIHYNFNPAKQAAAAVVEQIKAIGTVTLEKKDVIDKARAAYSALSDDAKKYISDTDLKLLTDAEAKYAQLKADKTKKEEVGAKNVVGNATYVVAKNQTVIYKANSKKNITTVKIPEKIQINGKDFTVTEIAASAFKNEKKLTKVTIPKNIKVIGKNAFSGCKKLKTITIKTTSLKTVGKSAFKNIAKNATIKVPKKKLTAYKKLLKKSGLASKVKVTK